MADETSQALSLQWAYGFSSTLSGGVVNLSGDDRSLICYVAAHTAVLYDCKRGKQTVLQGHCNPITCICATDDKSIVATADAGPDSMIVLWNTITGQPVHTIASPHPGGVLGMDISPSGTSIVTVSAVGDAGEQEIHLWDLTSGVDAPLVMGSIPEGDVQTCVKFHPETTADIMTNGKMRVFFWSSQVPYSREFKYYSPPVSARDFKQAVGEFTISSFLPGGTRAVTGTMDGDLVVWEEGRLPMPNQRASDRRAVKILRIHHAAVTALNTTKGYLVSGGAEGNVRFFDAKLRLTAWFDGIEAGAVRSVSFSSPPMFGESDPSKEFSCADFIIATEEQKVLSLRASQFEEVGIIDPANLAEPVLEGTPDAVAAIAAHPSKSEVACCGAGGLVWTWDYVNHRMGASRQLKGAIPAAIAYVAGGRMLLVGTAAGALQSLDSSSLEPIQSQRFSPAAVTRIAVSADSKYAACADAANTVSLFSFVDARLGEPGVKWEYVGKYRSHSAPVCGIVFHGEGAGTRLASVGEDGRLVTYDVPNSTAESGVQLGAVAEIGASAVPTAVAFVPSSAGSAAPPAIMVADDAFKLRTFTSDALACVKTVLGPTYGGPLTSLAPFKSAGSPADYLTYATAEKVVGLAAMPLDGDPNKAMGLIAHPSEVAASVVTHDGGHLITVGGAGDGVVNVWRVAAAAVDAAAAAAPSDDVARFASLVEGGRGGEFFQEIRQYFYYAQIAAQGEDTTAPREIVDKVPTAQVPALMRALGFYPSEADVADMLAELAAESAPAESDGAAAAAPPATVDFPRFLALYVNHRPVFGVGKEHIEEAFELLGAQPGEAVSREQLVEALTTTGEAMTRAELDRCLAALGGDVSDLPAALTARDFAEDVLGFLPVEEEAAMA